MENFKRSCSLAGLKIRKHSPEILTFGGLVLFGVTIVLVKKASPKVEKIAEQMEEDRAAHVEINKVEVAKDLSKALALPILTGTMAVSAIIWSHNIQRNRIFVLSGALATTQAVQHAFEEKYREMYGEEEYNKFIATDEVTTTIIDELGNEVQTVEEIKKELVDTEGMWYDKSSTYVSDDHDYNMQWIAQMSEDLDVKFFAKGYLLLNEVYEKLGFPKTRSGALLGWTTSGDYFNIEPVIFEFEDKATQQFKKQILVKWTTPKYIFGDVDFGSDVE